ncbi:MAG: hypothetical protein DRQ42_00630 [Gammaproteobacteria bacterium]|nr:MAG: hypothetical protein DRQ42_00630 [Gammaproteobacteria bacterium]
MPLQTKYRPTSFEEFYGNDDLVDSLLSALDRTDETEIPHSYLFTGSAGTGKTTLAFLLKNHFNIPQEDFYYYNAANLRGIDTIRGVLEKASYAPMLGDKKMYVFDECHQITHDAQEALLLQLEKPYNHVYYVLCTTEPNKLKEAFFRRPHKYVCKALRMDEMKELLTDIMTAESKNFFHSVLDRIVDVSNGSPGIALNMLDTVVDMVDEAAAIECISNLTHDTESVIAVARTLCDFSLGKKQKWFKIRIILNNLQDNPESSRRALLGYIAKVHLGDNGGMHTLEMLGIFEKSIIYSGFPGLVMGCHLACLVEK